MSESKDIGDWLKTYLEGTDMVLIDFRAGHSSLDVLLDAPGGITIGDCASVNRALRHHLGKDGERMDISVSSPGLDKPLTNPVQYVRHTGARVAVQLTDGGTCSGLLGAAGKKSIRIRIQKKRGREIRLTDEVRDIGFGNITSTNIIV